MAEPTKLESALDELLAGKTTEEIVGPDGLLKRLTKALIERTMNAEMSHHLGYEKHAPEGRGSGNNRNGSSSKRVQGDFGAEAALPGLEECFQEMEFVGGRDNKCYIGWTTRCGHHR